MTRAAQNLKKMRRDTEEENMMMRSRHRSPSPPLFTTATTTTTTPTMNSSFDMEMQEESKNRGEEDGNNDDKDESLLLLARRSTSPHYQQQQPQSSTSSLLLKRRIRAVRPEVINALSFASVVWTLHDEQPRSALKSLFLLSALVILSIDLYFIRCEWQLKQHRAIPFLRQFYQKAHMVGFWDDLLSDLPQSIWVLLYLGTFKFSFIAMGTCV
jgi:hypothetical protein